MGKEDSSAWSDEEFEALWGSDEEGESSEEPEEVELEEEEVEGEEEEEVEEERKGKKARTEDELRALLEELKRASTTSTPADFGRAFPGRIDTSGEEFDISSILSKEEQEELDETTLKALSKIAKAAYDRAVQKALSSAPYALQDHIRRNVEEQIYVSQFYRRNPQLVGKEAEVQKVANALWVRYPELQVNLGKFFGTLEKHIRRIYPPEKEERRGGSTGKAVPKSPTTKIGVEKGGATKKVSPADAFLSGLV